MSTLSAELVRVFLVGDLELPDPNPNMTVENAMRHLSHSYPEITSFNPTLEIVEGKAIYKCNASIGTKG